MNKEFKKIVEGKQTRYVLESATGGATSSAAVSSNSAAIPGMQRRSSLLTPEAEQKVPQKPRQGPLRPQTGAGKHKDKKRDDKQGKAKHKKPFYEDHEISMASNELKSIYADAKELLALVQKYGEQGDLEAWQQSKITKAADYLNSVLQSIGGEHSTELTELEKPSGTLYIIVLKDRSDAVRVVGDFGTFPAEVQARASKVGIKDKEGRKERPLKVNFLMTDASQALAELDKALADVDFIGSEKAEFVFKNSAFETDIEAEVQELHDLISSGADERFKNYEEPEVGNEPARKLKGVDHYIVDPITGKRKLVNKPTKPSRQLGGHAVQQPKTYTYRLQRTDLAPKLRDMGFKFDGNNIILSKQQRDQLLAKMGDKQFGMIFGQGDRFAEGWKGGMAGAGIGAALTRSPSGAMTGYKVGSTIGDMVGKKESDQDSEEHMNQTVSDLHREIYGFGPGKQFVYEWQKMSFDEKVKVYNKLKHLAGKLEEARYGRNHNPDSYSGSIPATDKIPQDSTAGQEKVQAIVAQMKQGTINNILTLEPGWGGSDLELMTATELNQILRDLQAKRVKKGQSEGAQKKPNATTRHLRDYPVSDKDMAKPVKKPEKPEKKKPEQGVAEGLTEEIPKSVRILTSMKNILGQYLTQQGAYGGNRLKDQLIPLLNMLNSEGEKNLAMSIMQMIRDAEMADRSTKGMSWGIMSKGLLQKLPALIQNRMKEGMAEGSLETDNMVSHISQIIQSIYPRGGDKNTYMKLVAQEMPQVVRDNPKLFRRAFGMAYDRFFHIDQDDDFDYTDYSMRKGERGMAEVRGNIDADQAGFYVVDDDGNAVSGPFASKQEAYERAAEMGRMYDVKYKGDIIPLDSLISKIIKTLPPDVTSDDLQDPMDLEQQLEILRSPLLKVFSKLSPYEQAEVTDEVANHFYDRRFGDLDEEKQKGVDGKACWKGYKRMGTKKKGGRTVDNCVKVGEDAYSESLMNQLNSIISEKAPPGDKYERMVKHIKKGYAKDGKISDKERSIAYATAWKAKNKAKK